MNTPVEKRMKPSWMAQVTAPHQYILDNLDKMGVGYKMDNVDPTKCKPMQEKIDTEKVKFFKEKIDNNQPLEPTYIAGDDEILDGHHRAFSFTEHPEVETMTAIKIYAEYKDAMRLLNQLQDRYEFEQEFNSGQMQPMGMLPADQGQGENGVAGDVVVAEEEEEDEQLPTEAPVEAEPSNAGTDRYVSYDSVGKNKQVLTLYKAKPLNDKAKTGDFLVMEKKPGFTVEYTLEFENLELVPSEEIENEALPTEALLKKWMPDADLQAEASKQGLMYPIYLSREINRMAQQKGIDGVQYGDLFVQVINKVI
jgi:hypothetical protein